MKIIEEISENIEDEIKKADCYAKKALVHKEDYPQLAEVYFKIANNRMADMVALHTQVAALIEDYKKTKGEVPEAMKTLYSILHKKHIENASAVKGMLALYKEI